MTSHSSSGDSLFVQHQVSPLWSNFHWSAKWHFDKKLNNNEAWSNQLRVPTHRASDPNHVFSGRSGTSQSGWSSMSSFSRATLGSFGHTMFSLKSIWLPDNYPVMINVMLAVNELNVANTKLNAPLHQNLTRSEKQALKDLRNNPNIILKISGQRL